MENKAKNEHDKKNISLKLPIELFNEIQLLANQNYVSKKSILIKGFKLLQRKKQENITNRLIQHLKKQESV